jgi:DNA-binding GntR family transcriptional regulator
MESYVDVARAPANLSPRSKPKLLSEFVYEELRRLILSNHFAPGELLVEEKIAAQWQVSRTPLRAALARLEKDGLVTITAHKGCVVTPITARDVIELFQVREGLEVLAVSLTTPHLPQAELQELLSYFAEIEHGLSVGDYAQYIPSDARFHALFVAYVPNRLLAQMLADVHDRVTRIRNFAHGQLGAHMREAFAEHRVVLARLCERDAEGAALAMRDHLRNVTKRTLELLPRIESLELGQSEGSTSSNHA